MDNIMPTIYFYESFDRIDKFNKSFKDLELQENLVFNPCNPRRLSSTLKIFDTTRFMFMQVFLELHGKYKKGDKFISGLKNIQVNNQEYYFGDYNQIKPRSKSLFIINFDSYYYTTISYYQGYYPEREFLYQTIYELIKQNDELINEIIKSRKYYIDTYGERK
jgi:hypothetical protein